MMEEQNPKVSIWMLAYNHSQYIRQAIDSILMQETTFEFEIVIGEDCSTDNTREILREYQQKYPQIIRVLFHENNVGIHKNFELTLKNCRGKYIALLEGDDYWTDPSKLQIQFDFMETNDDYSMCYQMCQQLDEETGDIVVTNGDDPDSIDLRYLLENGWFIRTCSIFCRSSAWTGFPDWFYGFYSTDYIFQVLVAEHGKIKCQKETTCVYRRHEAGITAVSASKQIKRWKDILKLMGVLDSYFEGKYSRELKKNKNKVKLSMIVFLLKMPGKKFSEYLSMIRLINLPILFNLTKRVFNYGMKKISPS